MFVRPTLILALFVAPNVLGRRSRFKVRRGSPEDQRDLQEELFRLVAHRANTLEMVSVAKFAEGRGLFDAERERFLPAKNKAHLEANGYSSTFVTSALTFAQLQMDWSKMVEQEWFNYWQANNSFGESWIKAEDQCAHKNLEPIPANIITLPRGVIQEVDPKILHILGKLKNLGSRNLDCALLIRVLRENVALFSIEYAKVEGAEPRVHAFENTKFLLPTLCEGLSRMLTVPKAVPKGANAANVVEAILKRAAISLSEAAPNQDANKNDNPYDPERELQYLRFRSAGSGLLSTRSGLLFVQALLALARQMHALGADMSVKSVRDVALADDEILETLKATPADDADVLALDGANPLVDRIPHPDLEIFLRNVWSSLQSLGENS